MPALVCLSTCPDDASAQRLAQALVEDRLAACVNIVPGVRSVYRWDGRVHAEAETLLVIKTTDACLAALTARLPTLHPYDVPELVALPVAGGLADYLHWIDAETGTARDVDAP
ncbi:divalent-cation tolerance protein CutA [Luteimonas sp. FCS-9]|uniref:divalent-cation tolerance protein CutA n=1 Tax=Luteimonas sp. FCS-9 TaxID=1547516 RepID=UPI00063ECE00|nr:divalent-cation tolerance protein CutA [Luteimonas sp. FCS-9]KLJ02413.1 hypothetical protein WQ56_02415 [Luteimonas sp. FCS-9]